MEHVGLESEGPGAIAARGIILLLDFYLFSHSKDENVNCGIFVQFVKNLNGHVQHNDKEMLLNVCCFIQHPTTRSIINTVTSALIK